MTPRSRSEMSVITGRRRCVGIDGRRPRRAASGRLRAARALRGRRGSCCGSARRSLCSRTVGRRGVVASQAVPTPADHDPSAPRRRPRQRRPARRTAAVIARSSDQALGQAATLSRGSGPAGSDGHSPARIALIRSSRVGVLAPRRRGRSGGSSRVRDRVGRVPLRRDAARVVVGVEVAVAVAELLGAGVVGVAQVRRDRADLARRGRRRCAASTAVITALDFGARASAMTAWAEVEPRLRHADQLDRLGGGDRGRRAPSGRPGRCPRWPG